MTILSRYYTEISRRTYKAIAAQLSNVLPRMANLRVISIDYNEVGLPYIIIRSILSTPQLRDLRATDAIIDGNHIPDEPASALRF